MELIRNQEVIFDELTHSYWKDGRELSGVTSMMKAMGLSPDYSGVDAHTLAHAAARGTAVHRTLEHYDNGTPLPQPVTVDDNEGGKLTLDTSADLKAYLALGLNVAASEYLVSDNECVASSIDKVLATEEEGVFDLADIKTTYTLHIDALEWQLSIYAYLFELQNGGAKVRDLYGVHVRKGSARKVKVKRIPGGEVARLIECFREGLPYTPPESPLSEVIPAAEVAELVAQELAAAKAEEALKELETALKERRERIYAFMLEKNVKELECGGGRYVLRKPTTRTTLDYKKLKAEKPDTYAKYASVTEVKGSVTYKLNQ